MNSWRILPVAAAAAFTLLLHSCSDRGAKLPTYGLVPHFVMTASTGQLFDSSALAGKVWVADFIYTHCPGPCPRMTSQMHKLQQQIGESPAVRLVSISVDPDRDTPAVLDQFAHRFGGPAPNWVFLTGQSATVHTLAHDVFKIGDLIGVMDHSTKFMLVDKQGDLRGYYSTFDEDGIPNLLADIRALAH